MALDAYGVMTDEFSQLEDNWCPSKSTFLSANFEELLEVTQYTASWLVGCVFGRWDISFATGKKSPPELPDPFAPLPVCPPGMLQNADGLPTEPKDVPTNYPLRIPWPGLLGGRREPPGGYRCPRLRSF